MKKKILVSFLILGMVIAAINGGISISMVNASSQSKTSTNNSNTLQIYTYQSLMSYPYYDIESNFTAYSGINVNITRFSDANQLVTELVSQKNNPQADIIIGIDNALEQLINVSDYFVQYQNTSVLNNINPTLINNLDPSHYLVPYDYGVIGLTYQNQLINDSQYPFLNNFTFNNYLNSNLPSKTIMENPSISSTALAFLLSTIATYGDPTNNRSINGLLGQNWQNFWSKAGNKMNLTNTWDSAYTIFSSPNSGKPMMVSYLTDPAYNYCLYNDSSVSSVITTLANGTKSGWFQIEGMGIVKNSPRQTEANIFMNWFLSKSLQDNIPESQWMFPANTKATIPACFAESGVPNLSSIVPLNNYLSTQDMKKYMNDWINEWQQLLVTKNLPSFDFTSVILIIPFFVAIAILRKRKTF